MVWTERGGYHKKRLDRGAAALWKGRVGMGFLRKFMSGRYGGDQLGNVTLALYLAVYLLYLLTGWRLLWLLAVALVVVTLFRILSRNIPKRQAENQRFLSLTAPLRRTWRAFRNRCTDRSHKYFKCPGCGRQLRVPRGAGKIRVTCRFCGTTFEENS